MLELYYWEPNTFFLKPLIALQETRLEFTPHYFDALQFEQFSKGFPRTSETLHNVENEGPLLISAGTVMCGSFFLLEYIADSAGGDWLSSTDPYERYMMQEWAQVTGKMLGICVSLLGCVRYLAPVLREIGPERLSAKIGDKVPAERRKRWLELIDGSLDSELLDLIRQRLDKYIQQIEKRLAASPWLVGKRYSIADIDVFSLIWTLPGLAPDSVNEVKAPRMLEYIERIRQRPAVQSALSMSRCGRPQECFVPGIEPSRWLGL